MLTLSKSLAQQATQAQGRREKLQLRMVHIGFGAFFRAHQAWCTDYLTKHHCNDWGYAVVSLNNSSAIAALASQDYLYTVTQRGENNSETAVVGTVLSAMSQHQQGTEAIIELLCEPQITIVSMTVTEKGYYYSPADGQLAITHPDIRYDIQHPSQPRSLPGVLLEAMVRRQQRGLTPLTVLSCDNVPQNGEQIKQSIKQLAQHQQRPEAMITELLTYNTFPSTMVDRIVPAMSEEDRQWLSQQLGGDDRVGVICEPFYQWVIEDNFAASRPQWELAGVTFTDNIEAWEEMKLRMLNGSHSFLAYVGWLAGYKTIYQCLQDPQFKLACQHLMLVEQAPTLAITDVDLIDYSQQLIDRFSNSKIKHLTRQIASDGSLKIPQRWLQSLKWQVIREGDYELLALGIAAWIRYLWGIDEQNNENEVIDPHYHALQQSLHLSPDTTQQVHAIFSHQDIFDPKLLQYPRLLERVNEYYLSLQQRGAKKTLDLVLQQISLKKIAS